MAGIPRPRTQTWLGANRKRAVVSRSRNIDLDFEEEEEEEGSSKKKKGKDIFSESMSSVLESIFNDIDNHDDTPIQWEDAMEILVKIGGKAVAMSTTLVVSHGILLGVKSAFQRLMVFRW